MFFVSGVLWGVGGEDESLADFIGVAIEFFESREGG